MKITNIKELRELIKDLDDDYSIEMRIRTKLSDDEIIKSKYLYPYKTQYINGFEYDDIGVSDKVLCIGVESKL